MVEVLLNDDNSIKCEDCDKKFENSYLMDNFNFPVCDSCKDPETHSLMTRTNIKKKYLLQDHDLDHAEPELKYLLRRNPHNNHWGRMKLYLELQVADLALNKWGSEEAMEKEKESKATKRESSKRKKMDNRIKDLRVLTVTKKKKSETHKHEFDEEVYNKKKDTYRKECKTCDHVLIYEKM